MNNHIEVIKAKESGVFTNYIFKAIPLAFDESMSYYETLCALLDYLKNTVITTLNNNADAIIELQNNVDEFETNVNNTVEELESFINNYFNNLDVQQEINNKLDEMVTDGTFEELIQNYFNTNITWTYNNVDEMKNSTTLLNGNFVRTSGYYTYNDNGGSLYKIREKTNEDIIDDMLIIGLNNEELIAEFIPNNDYINVMQLGLDITDSETNITTKLNNILNTNLNLIFKNLIFDIDDELNLKSNTKLKLQNCHITNISDENKKYILNINEINNVEIEGINTILEFNKPETTQQACIHIKDAKNISIKGLTLQKAGGEGIIASGTADGDTENIVIYNCKIDNNRRNGIALIGGVYNVTIDNCEIINTSGTSPQFAIDLEPWTDNIYNDTITIKNCYIKGNTNGGIDILKQNKNILIEHNTFINNGIQSVATLSIGEDNYPKNCIIKNNTILGSLIYLRGIRYSQYSILNNYFDNNGRITIDTESDYTSINSGYPNGSLLIEGNTLNNVTGNQAISIGGARNVLVKNNTINNCSFRAVTIYSSYNVIIDSNIVNNYQTDENAENTGVALSTQTTTYLEIRNNNLYRDETHAMNLNKVIYIANNNNYVKVINNKAPVGNYTNMFDNGCTTAVFINNESKSLYNDTTLGLPTPSRNYLGLIYNYYDSLNDIYKPKICVYDTDTSDYIWLDLNT